MRGYLSRVPTRTSADTLVNIIQRLGAFYRLPLVCQLDENARTAAIDLAHSTIILPAWLTKANLAKAFFYSLHEILHQRVMPCTSHMQAYYVALAAEQGVKAPEILSNLVFDQVVNDHGMVESPFREEFRKGCAAFYRDRAAKARKRKDAALWAHWHFGNMNQRCNVIQGKRITPPKNGPPPETLTKLYALVFEDPRPFEARYREICTITKDWFAADEQTGDYNAPWPCGGRGPFPPIADPKELEEWIAKMRSLSRKNGIRGARATGSKRVLMDYAEISSLEEYIICQSNQARRARAVGGPESPDEIWNPADRVDELDLRLTLQSTGLFLPYVTALKRVAGTDTTEETQGTGIQCYILDISGSMCASLDLVAMLCFAVSRHARTRRDEIAVLTFSDADAPEFLMKPCRDYDQVRPTLETLESGGQTYLAPALEWLNQHCTEKHLKPTTTIFSDTMIADEIKTLEELRKIKESCHGMSILVNTEKHDDPWVRTAMQQGFLENFRVDQDHLGDVQRILTHIVT
jgi:Mg-chelatase subunit ChlD